MQKYVELNEFAPYVDKFIADSVIVREPVKIDNLIIHFADLSKNPNTLGQCTVGMGTVPTIEIDFKHWGSLEEATRVALLYHELGHCVLGLSHTENPNSIMYPYILDPDFFTNFYSTLVQDLFDAAIPAPEYVELVYSSNKIKTYALTDDGCEEEE